MQLEVLQVQVFVGDSTDGHFCQCWIMTPRNIVAGLNLKLKLPALPVASGSSSLKKMQAKILSSRAENSLIVRIITLQKHEVGDST